MQEMAGRQETCLLMKKFIRWAGGDWVVGVQWHMDAAMVRGGLRSIGLIARFSSSTGLACPSLLLSG